MPRKLIHGISLSIPLFVLAACNFASDMSINSDVAKGRALVEKKEYAKAIAVLQPVIDKGTKNSQALYYAAFADTELGKQQEALDLLNLAIEADPGYAEAYSERALVQTRMGDNDAASADINQAIRLAPDVPLNYLRRAIVNLNAKNYQPILDDMNVAEKLTAKDTKKPYWVESYRGEGYAGLKAYPKALASFDEAIKRGGKEHPVLYFRRALVRAQKGDFAGAERDCNTYLAANKNDFWPHALIGALRSANGNSQDAAQEYAKALGARPSDLADACDLGASYFHSITDLADLYLQKKDPEKAAAVLTRVEAHRPLEPQEQYRLAVANFQLDRPERAISLLNACIAMSPDYVAPRVELIRYYASSGLVQKALELQREAYTVARSPRDRAEVAGAMLRR